jgi:hypothetical protein
VIERRDTSGVPMPRENREDDPARFTATLTPQGSRTVGKGPTTGQGQMRAKHFVGLMNEFLMYSVVNRAWWVLPTALLLAAMMLLITIGQTAAPFTLYALF